MATKRTRRCAGKAKTGKRCRAVALKGRKHCRAHDPELEPAERFGTPEQAALAGAADKPRTPRPRELMLQRVLDEVDAVLAPYFEGLRATDADGRPEFRTRLRAAEALFDRLYGRPKTSTEISGPDGAPLRVEDPRLDLSKLSEQQLDELEGLVRDATPDR